MNNYYKTKGIIFASRDVGEYDRIITCFTKEYGRVELLAKAVRKITSKLRGGLEPFCLSWLEFVEGKRGFIVTEAIQQKKFFVKDNIIGGALEALASFRDFFLEGVRGREKDERIWSFLIPFLSKFTERPVFLPTLEFLAEYGKWNIAALCGYAPEVKKCIRCQAAADVSRTFFSMDEGGIICAKCASGRNEGVERISAKTAQFLYSIENFAHGTEDFKREGMPLVSEFKKINTVMKNNR